MCKNHIYVISRISLLLSNRSAAIISTLYEESMLQEFLITEKMNNSVAALMPEGVRKISFNVKLCKL